jgi:hypothetical protein
MWDKIKENSLIVFVYSIYLFGLIVLIYIPVKCTMGIVDRIQNPPSEIYAENQTLDKWKTFCIEGNSEDCEVYGRRLKTKSYLLSKENEVDIISVIEVDEFNMQLSIKLRDWNTGELIQPFPQEKHKWYQFFKNYESFETIGTLIDDDGNNIISYEVSLLRNEIIFSEKSCNSKGLEDTSADIKGGCFFIEEYDFICFSLISLRFTGECLKIWYNNKEVYLNNTVLFFTFSIGLGN